MSFSGKKDALAMLSLAAGAIGTSPLFAGFPLAPFVASVYCGAGWLTWQTTRSFRNRHIDATLKEGFVIKSDPVYIEDEDDSLLFGVTTDNHEQLRVKNSFMARHSAIIGQSGVGKTVFAEFLLWSQVARGGGYVFLDPKLDAGQKSRMAHMAKITGREEEFYVINVNEPDNSNTYNPILFGDPDEVASRLMNLVPSTEGNAGADHYKQTATYALTVIVAALQVANKLYTFGDLSIILQSSQAIEKLIRLVPESGEKRSLEIFVDQFRKRTKNGSEIDTERMKTALGGMAGRIAMFAQGKFGAVFNTVAPEVNLFEIIRDKKMLYVQLPTMGKDIAALNLGKMVVSDLRSACAMLQELDEHLRPNPPCMVLLDEFNSIVMEGVARLFEQARSASVALLPAFQSFGGLRKVSPDFAEQIIQNTWNKIFFKFGSKEAEEAAELLGKTYGYIKSLSISESESSGAQLLRTDPNATDSDGYGVGESWRQQEEFRFDPDKIKALSIGEAFVMVGARAFHIKTPMVVFPDNLPHHKVIKHHVPVPFGKTPLEFEKLYKSLLIGGGESANDEKSKDSGDEKNNTKADKVQPVDLKGAA